MTTKNTAGDLNLEGMHFDDLWLLHQQLIKILAKRINAEKVELDNRLARLNSNTAKLASSKTPRRKYPKVLPKYSNPEMPTETWSGRGKQPRWLVAALSSGRKLEDFLIGERPSSPRRGRRPQGT